MDPLTHSLTGAVLADTGLARRTPLAATTLILAANLADIDVLSHLAGSDAALGLRRGLTHGILAMVLLPPLLAGAIASFHRRWRWRHRPHAPTVGFARLVPLAYLGFASHPLLDWLTTYGIRWLMPFDNRWFYGDAVFIIDPWLWLGLGGAVFLRHSRSRRSLLAWAALGTVTTAVFIAGSVGYSGARVIWVCGLLILITLRWARLVPTDRRRRARLAVGALLAAGLYAMLLLAASRLARQDVETQLIAAGASVEEIMVGPLPIRPLYHAVVVDTGTQYRVGSYDWFSEPRLLLDRRPLAKPPWTAVVAAALRAPCLRGMVGWVRFPWVEIEQTELGDQIIHLMDARYSRKRTSSFGGSSVRLGPDLSDRCDYAEQ